MKALSSCLAAIALILLTTDLGCVAGQFSFSLPGKWGKGKRSPFKFSLPGDWGNRSGRRVGTSTAVEECPHGMDIERMFDILNRLQDEEARVRDCIQNLTTLERYDKPEQM